MDNHQSHRIAIGTRIVPLELTTVSGVPAPLPCPGRLTHLQFRRFAGCPVCDLHLASFRRRHAEIMDAEIAEVVVFHSPAAALQAYSDELPFALIADPEKRLYRRFGVEQSPRALLDPRAWPFILGGVVRSLVRIVRGRQPMPPISPEGGSLGLPADFLIAPDGTLVACHYGAHAYDQWSVDTLLALGRIGSCRD